MAPFNVMLFDWRSGCGGECGRGFKDGNWRRQGRLGRARAAGGDFREAECRLASASFDLTVTEDGLLDIGDRKCAKLRDGQIKLVEELEIQARGELQL